MRLLLLLCLASFATALVGNTTQSNNDCNYQDAVDQCEYIRSNSNCDGNYVNYLELYICHPNLQAPLLLIYLVWLILVSYMLGTTADVYFCPCLEEMADRLKMSHQLAGVTLLSLGNGASDIFIAIAAIRIGQPDLLVGNMSGSGMFLSSVIAGVVIFVGEGIDMGASLIRDIVAYLISIGLVCLMLQLDLLTHPMGGLLLALYVLYVGLVLAMDKWVKTKLHRRPTDLFFADKTTETLSEYFSTEQALESRPETSPLVASDDFALPLKTVFLLRMKDVFNWFEAPFNVLRSISIVNAVSKSWSHRHRSRLLAALAVCLTPMLIGLWQHLLDMAVGDVQMWVVLLAVGVAGGVVVALTCPERTPPKYSIVLLTVGFISAAVWIDIFASELVALLVTLGYLTKIPQLVLGVTVLAWGNCINDLMANYLMARNKRKEMAIAACYAGPVFNLLMGVSLGVLLRPDQVHTTLSNNVLLSFSFLVAMLLVTLFGAIWQHFHLSKVFGGLLCAYYVVYAIVVVVMGLI